MITVNQLLHDFSMNTVVEVTPDHIILNDIYGDVILKRLNGRVAQNQNVKIFIDHVVPSDCPETDAKQVTLRSYARENQVYFQEAQGIAYPKLVRETLKPGDVVMGCGMHLHACGALGCISLIVGEDELAQVMVDGSYSWKVPGITRILLTGELPSGMDAMSLAMHLKLQNLDAKEVVLIAVEHASSLTVDQRMVVCGALGELGFPMVSFIPDTETERYLAEVGRAATVETVRFTADQIVSLSKVKSYVKVPENNEIVEVEQISAKRVKSIFIGGCMGGNEQDIQKVYEHLKGKKVAKYVRLLVVPNTQQVYLKAVNEGWIDALEDAGVMVMNPHCSACWGRAQGHVLDDESAVTTGFRNCPGCLGAEYAKVYITSVDNAIRTALTGMLGE